jgi:hypothetical protein
MPNPTTFRRFVEEQVRKVLERRADFKEQLIAHYLAATGADPRDLVLCEQTDGAVTRWWVEQLCKIEVLNPPDPANPFTAVTTALPG